jgi:thiol-disulfide isomerase/thioredoxin
MQDLLASAVVLAVTVSAASAAPQYGKAPPRGKDTPKQGQPTPPSAPPAGDPKGPADANSPGEARFYEKLDPADRDALQVNVGYMVPAPVGQIDWIGGDPLMAADFRGTVTVIQSIGGKTSGRGALEKTKKLLPDGVRLLALHTPDEADRAQTVYGQNTPCLIAVDKTGEWCDALGVWKRPVNIVVDKSGAVRYVGLSEAGLRTKLEVLQAEEVDESVVARPRPNAPKATEAGEKPAAWPVFNEPITGAADMRGRTMPQFAVQKWITRQPDPAGRLIAVDFWATWCPPCRASIPHINELQSKFGSDVLFVGVSSESQKDFEQGLVKYKLKPEAFQYSLALDPPARMSKFLDIKGIPHMAILSPDLVVRWQGHPGNLQEADIQKLVAANKALSKMPARSGGARGWVDKGPTTSPGR